MIVKRRDCEEIRNVFEEIVVQSLKLVAGHFAHLSGPNEFWLGITYVQAVLALYSNSRAYKFCDNKSVKLQKLL